MKQAVVEQLDGTTIEYLLAPNMVVFSHGFGVRRDTSGFFTDIANHLPEEYGYVLFDYYEYDEAHNTVVLTDFSQQTLKLRKIITWTKQQSGVQTVSIIAHSMGCIVTALARPDDITTVIFLAPPTSIGENSRNYFTTKRGAKKQGTFWLIPRSDGTTSKLAESVLKQLESTNATDAIQNYASTHPIHVIYAGADEVLSDADYSVFKDNKNLDVACIDGATHNFTEEARKKLLEDIKELL